MVRTESHLVLAEHLERRHQRLQDSVALVIRKCQAQRVAVEAEVDMQAEAKEQTRQALHQFMVEVQAVAATRSDTRSAQAKQVSMD
jgi:DNA-nicking Smr family endonuclease